MSKYRPRDGLNDVPAPMELRKVIPLRKKMIRKVLIRETSGAP